ncbi:MAG TPA: hypothetical protein VGE51_07400 [Fontimonas sp.]
MPSFRLVYGDADVSVGLPFESHIEEQLFQLLDLVDSRTSTASRIADVITSMLESEVPAPSESQLKYAVAIARALGLQLTAEVLQSKEAMREFLGQHADSYRRRKGELRKQRAASGLGNS